MKMKYRVSIGASKIGSAGGLYYIKRTYEIECEEHAINGTAIARAYQDGDIEHVRIEKVEALP